ncbi:MAG: hypothetical protein CL565_02550 [Alphaproteobacteria bacterium]|nr:hypothetical protein [Alphaproteobacteria bacterium]|tara:strand:- start:224 stop:868 length:645 start_codon:yes stop_codon:yes gene_type:complete
MKKYNNCNGNVLFLILIAVVLFAALSYAISNSGRGGGDTSKEKSVIIASQITEFATNMRYAIQRMTIMGTASAAIEFHPNGSCSPTYMLCNTGENCLFAPEGGAINFVKLPQETFSGASGGMGYPGDAASEFTTNFWLECTPDMYDWGHGTPAGDRGFFLLNVAEQVCHAFNEGVGIEGIPGHDYVMTDEVNFMEHCIQRNDGTFQIGFLLQAF